MPVDTVWISVLLPTKEAEHAAAERKIQLARGRFVQQQVILTENNNLNQDKSKEDSNSMEKMLENALNDLKIEDAIWVKTRGDKAWHVYFQCDLSDNDATLSFLQDRGFGTVKGTALGFIPYSVYWTPDEDDEEDEIQNNALNKGLQDFYTGGRKDSDTLDKFQKKQNKFLESITSHLTVAQVVEGVRSGSEVTFDFLFFTLFASWIACNGLVNTAPIDIAASMCIEPIMGTVMAVTFGIIVREKSLFNTGVYAMVVSIMASVIFGFVYGMIAFNWVKEINPPPTGIFPTPEMQSRGTTKSLWYGTLIGLPGGGAVALCLLNNNIAAIVGVAIATTFMPPAANAGLCWALAIHMQIQGNYQDYEEYSFNNKTYMLKEAWAPPDGYQNVWDIDMRKECGILGLISMCYTGINVVTMFVAAIIILRIKEVAPLGSQKDMNRFFRKDVQNYREYRKSIAAGATGIEGQAGEISDHILRNWAEIAGLDPKLLLSQSPEAQLTQLQTLRDIAQDIENDTTFQNVVRHAYGRPDANVFRRLSRGLSVGTLSRNRTPASARPGFTFGDSEAYIGSGGNGYLPDRRPYFMPDGGRQPPDFGGNVMNSGRTNYGLTMDENETDQNDTTESRRAPISAGLGMGLSLRELAREDRRRSSLMLRRQLSNAPHGPYSVWPSSALQVTDAEKRTSQLRRLSSLNSSLRRRRLSRPVNNYGATAMNGGGPRSAPPAEQPTSTSNRKRF